MKPARVHFCTHSVNSSVSLSSQFLSVLNSVSGKKKSETINILVIICLYFRLCCLHAYTFTFEFCRRNIDGLMGHMWWRLMCNTCFMTPLNCLSLTQYMMISLDTEQLQTKYINNQNKWSELKAKDWINPSTRSIFFLLKLANLFCFPSLFDIISMGWRNESQIDWLWWPLILILIHIFWNVCATLLRWSNN